MEVVQAAFKIVVLGEGMYCFFIIH